MNDSHDSDGLSEFATELGADTPRTTTRTRETSVPKTRSARPPASTDIQTSPTDIRTSAPASKPTITSPEEIEDDWLSVFVAEPLDLMSGMRGGALTSADDELNQFLPDPHAHHASDEEDVFLDQFPEQLPVPPVPRAILQARSQPWAGPWAAAVVAVGICVLLATRSLYPAWWNAGLQDVRPSATNEGEVSSVLPPALPVSTPAVERGIPSRTLRRFETVPVSVPPLPVATAGSQRVSHAAPIASRMTSPPASATPPATRRAVSESPRETTLLAQRSDRPAAVEMVPLAPVVVPQRSGEEFLPETQHPVLRPDAAVASYTPPSSSTAAVQEYAVRRALTSYEKAYEDLDVAATAAVWPSVDRRALARAFDTLTSQGLDFKSCAITVMDANATARCRGTLQVVRKIGNSMPLTAEQEWVFTMRRTGTEWKIDAVAASQVSGRPAPRTPTQG